MTMSLKKAFNICLLIFGIILPSMAQVSQATIEKREKRKNLTIKEWNTNEATKSKYLDHVTTYDDKGRKTEETEYANYGMKERTTYEYDEKGLCIKEVVYNSHNKPYRIRKFEYTADGTKKTQYNYLPNGKLETTKVFEYIFK